MSLLSKFRDSVVEKLVRNNELVQKFGEIQSLRIDSEKGEAQISILLNGEAAPLRFSGFYTFEDSREGVTLVCRTIRCERKWINDALELYLSGNPIRQELPRFTGGLARIIF